MTVSLLDLLNALPDPGESLSMNPEIVPFSSDDTLSSEYTLVKSLPDGTELYVHKSMRRALIGTRGMRSTTGPTGLIIHATIVKASCEERPLDSKYEIYGRFTNISYTHASPESLLDLITSALDKAQIELI